MPPASARDTALALITARISGDATMLDEPLNAAILERDDQGIEAVVAFIDEVIDQLAAMACAGIVTHANALGVTSGEMLQAIALQLA